MKHHENVPAGKPATRRQMTEIYGMLIKAVPDLTHAQAQLVIGRQRQVSAQLRHAVFRVANPYANLISEWEAFYQALAIPGLDVVHLSTVRIPTPKDGFTRLIVVLPGLKIEEILAHCAKRFPVWRWTNEDFETLTTSTRLATADPYAVWVRDLPEADPNHAGKSFNDCQNAGIVGITLLERLLLELKYFMETGKHLDIQNVTLCTGSHYRDGGVPCVHWGGSGKLGVSWYSADHSNSNLRCREVVV